MGKVVSVTGSLADTVGVKNPLRYRGYYYDIETKLYYLQSRYYDPETCRFINADSLLVAGDDYIQGVNMFAYCQNNPVMYSDPSGQKANALTFLHRIISRFIFGNVGGTDESLFEIIVMLNAATKALGYNFSDGEIFVSTDVSSSGVVHVIITLSNTQLNGEAPNNYIIEMFYGNNSEWAAENKLCDESSFIEGILGFVSSSIVSYFVPPLASVMILLELGIALSPDEYKTLVDDMLIAASRNPQANTYGILQIYYAGTNKFVYKHS